jgi:hypothetical protein
MPRNRSKQETSTTSLVSLAMLFMQLYSSLQLIKVPRLWLFLLLGSAFAQRAAGTANSLTSNGDIDGDGIDDWLISSDSKVEIIYSSRKNIDAINRDDLPDLVIGASTASNSGYKIWDPNSIPTLPNQHKRNTRAYDPIDAESTRLIFFNRCPTSITEITFTGQPQHSDTFLIGATPPNWRTVINGFELDRKRINIITDNITDSIDISLQHIDRLNQIELVNRGSDSELLFPSGHVVQLRGINWETLLHYHQAYNFFHAENAQQDDKEIKSKPGTLRFEPRYRHDYFKTGLLYPHTKVTYQGNPSEPDVFRLLPPPTQQTIISHFDTVAPEGGSVDSINLIDHQLFDLKQVKISINGQEANLTFPNGHLLQLQQVNPVPLLQGLDSFFQSNDWRMEEPLTLENKMDENESVIETLLNGTKHQFRAGQWKTLPFSASSTLLPQFNFQSNANHWQIGLPDWLHYDPLQNALISSSKAEVGTTLLHADWASEHGMEREWLELTVLPPYTWWQWLTLEENLSILKATALLIICLYTTRFSQKYLQAKLHTRSQSLRFFQDLSDQDIVTRQDVDAIYVDYKAIAYSYFDNTHIMTESKKHIWHLVCLDFSDLDKEIKLRQKIFRILKDRHPAASFDQPEDKINRELKGEIIFTLLVKEFFNIDNYGQVRCLLQLNRFGSELTGIDANILSKIFNSTGLQIVTDQNLIAENKDAVKKWNQFITEINRNIIICRTSDFEEKSPSNLKNAVVTYAFELLYRKGAMQNKLADETPHPTAPAH